MKKRLVFISNMAAPYQVKFCYALQAYYDAEFWFHVYTEPDRPDWWRIDLGEKCRLLDKVLFRKSHRYLSLDIVKELNKFAPDIVVLGGFALPSVIVAYNWAKFHRKKVVMFTEVSRHRNGGVREKSFFTKFVRFLYRDIDAILTSATEGTEQFKSVFGFGDRVFTAQYPSDIDEQLKHPLREKRKVYTYLYANRLTPIYDPILAIDIFSVVQRKYPGSKMLMNASGELLEQCQAKISELDLDNAIQFLDRIQSWNDLHKVYQGCDILLLPANFSAGNLTIIESMASGMGIVVSNKILGPGIDHITHGQNGFICNPGVEDFVSAIDVYNQQPDLLKVHGEINKAIARRYSIAETAILWDKLLSAVVSQQ